MFQDSSTIDSSLNGPIKTIENSFIGESVIAARIFETPALKFKVRLLVSRPSKLTILEEFVLRAATELNPCPTEHELADALSLDHVFVHTELQKLTRFGAIEEDRLPEIVATERGGQFYEEGAIIKPDQEESCTAYVDCKTGETLFSEELENTISTTEPEEEKKLPVPHNTSMSDQNGEASTKFSLEFIRSELSSFGVHKPEEGRLITEILSVEREDLVWRSVGVFAVNDLVEQKIRFHVIDLETKKFDLELEKIIEEDIGTEEGGDELRETTYAELLLDTMEVSETAIKDYFQSGHRESPSYFSEIETVVRETIAAEREAYKKDKDKDEVITPTKEKPATVEHPHIEYLADREIRPRFLETIASARQDIMIVSPWINSDVVDNQFIDMLKRAAKNHILIVMGWGFEDRIGNEKPRGTPDARLVKDLESVRTPLGVQAIALVWLGNQHIKEVIVDRRIHLCGSQNWLSYRGTRMRIIGQSVYYVEGESALEKPSNHVENLFMKAIEREWNRFVKSPSKHSLRNLCATAWSTLRRKDVAFHAAEHFLEAHPRRKEDAVEFLRQLCLCQNSRMITSKDKSMRPLLSDFREIVHKWGLSNGNVSNYKKLKNHLDRLENEFRKR